MENKIKPYFICELGINHHGDFNKARRMVELAKEAGASAVKTQFYDADKLLGKEHPLNAYAKSCQLSRFQHEMLSRQVHFLGMDFGCSVFDRADLPWTSGISDFIKVASRMNRGLDFIKEAVDTKKRVIMSIQDYGMQQPLYNIDYMWCVPEYPAPKEKSLNFIFDEKHGFSSHCPDPEVTVIAYEKGARLFEHHVCESKKEDGCDIPSSLSFQDYKKVIETINARG